MNYQYNEQFAAATRQFADAAARINHLALENAQKVFGLQLAALEEMPRPRSRSSARRPTCVTWTA